MKMEFERRGAACLRPLLRQQATQEQTQELRLGEDMPDIGQILATWGQVILRGKEWRGDMISCSAGVMAWVLYAPAEGGKPRVLETWIPVQMKWDLDDQYRDGEIRLTGLLRFLDARSVTARKIMLRCGLGMLAEAFCRDTVQVAVPGALPEDIQLLRRRYPARMLKAAGEKTFSLEEELAFPGGVPEKLLAYTLEPRVSEARFLSGKLVIRGVCQFHGVCENAEGKIRGWDMEIPFSQLEEPEGSFSPEAQANVRMGVTGMEAELTPEGKLLLKCGLVAQYVMDDREMLELVEDAYSLRRQVAPIGEELDLPLILEQKLLGIPVNQSIHQKVREVADVTYLMDFPELRRGEGVHVELPGQFQVLCYDEEGSLRTFTARTEENLRIDADQDSRLEAALLPGAPPAASAGAGIELRAEPMLQMQTTSRQGIPMVTGLELGEETAPDPARPSLILRRAGESDLWEIAKKTGSTVEAIRKANALEAEPRQDQMLLIPVM